eukprot:SAG22_NODE_16191_length_331_cov_0.659483_1_plen_59_part_10
MDVYKFFCDYLAAGGAGMALPAELPTRNFIGIDCELPPMVVLSPAFVLQVSEAVPKTSS